MYLLFDIGGTKMRLAISDGENLGNPIIVATPRDFEEGIETFEKVAQNLSNGKKFEKAVGGVRALDKSKTSILENPHFKFWDNMPLKSMLEEVLQTSVYLENDAAMAGLGEAGSGAGKDYDVVAYITVSTGLGGAKIVNKKIDPSYQGFEPGNQIIHIDSHLSSINNVGFLESFVSGVALEEKYGKKAFEIEDPDVWEEMAEYLAFGLNNISVLWSPEAIVLGGSLMEKIQISRVEYHLKRVLKIFPTPPKLLKSQLGDTAGLHGALEYLKQI